MSARIKGNATPADIAEMVVEAVSRAKLKQLKHSAANTPYIMFELAVQLYEKHILPRVVSPDAVAAAVMQIAGIVRLNPAEPGNLLRIFELAVQLYAQHMPQEVMSPDAIAGAVMQIADIVRLNPAEPGNLLRIFELAVQLYARHMPPRMSPDAVAGAVRQIATIVKLEPQGSAIEEAITEIQEKMRP
jgi:hypothetical protein